MYQDAIGGLHFQGLVSLAVGSPKKPCQTPCGRYLGFDLLVRFT